MIYPKNIELGARYCSTHLMKYDRASGLEGNRGEVNWVQLPFLSRRLYRHLSRVFLTLLSSNPSIILTTAQSSMLAPEQAFSLPREKLADLTIEEQQHVSI